MNEQQQLLSKILEDEYDDFAIDVYCDWLEENGFEQEASRIRNKGWRYSGLTHLVGKTVHSLSRTDDQLLFLTDSDPVLAVVEGDCCSDSWFYSITGVENLIGQKVYFIIDEDDNRNLDVDIDDGLGRQESDSAYGIGVVTEKGICTIIHRNSSNGYYGGELRSYIDKLSKLHPDWKGEPVLKDWVTPPVVREKKVDPFAEGWDD